MLTSRRSVLASSLTSALAGNSFPALAQNEPHAEVPSGTRSFSDPNEQLIYQRAIEAVIWSMPAMSDVFFRDSMFSTYGMKPGDVMVMSRTMSARQLALTPNNQVNYSGLAFDLTAGPWVVVIPGSDANYAIIGEFCDNWQAPITMVGVPGPDGGKGGKYLLLPPGYKDDVPADYIPVRLEGFRGMLVFRPVIIGHGTMEGAVALARQTQASPLDSAANPKPSRVVDGSDRDWNSLPVYDTSWFKKLAQFVNDEPIRARDKVAVGMLSVLGIERGKPFNPDTKTVALLETAVKDAYEIMQHGFVTPGRALAAWWPDRQWMNFNPAYLAQMGEGWSFENEYAVLTYERSVCPFFWANYMPKELGGEQMYLTGLRDATGKLFSGKSTYRLRVPADVPAEKFWSVIVYSQKTKAFVPNALNRYGLSTYDKPKLNTNTDGSVDIYFGDRAAKGYEANWLPSAGEDFFLLFRLYGPAQSAYDKTWKLPDVEKI